MFASGTLYNSSMSGQFKSKNSGEATPDCLRCFTLAQLSGAPDAGSPVI